MSSTSYIFTATGITKWYRNEKELEHIEVFKQARELAQNIIMKKYIVFDTEYTAWKNSLQTNWSRQNEYKELVQISAIKVNNSIIEKFENFEKIEKILFLVCNHLL